MELKVSTIISGILYIFPSKVAALTLVISIFKVLKQYVLYKLVNNNLSRYVSLTEDEIAICNRLLEPLDIAKKTLLLHAGEKCNFEAYVVKGCLRKYYIDASGAEVVIQFAIEDAWVSDISFSIYEDKPSQVFIETLEDCQLLIFTPESKEKLFLLAPKFERVFRILVQRNLSATQNRLFDAIAKTATEKYTEFLEQYPTLSQRVAQHHIASYLGMSAEFLSKVRGRLSKP